MPQYSGCLVTDLPSDTFFTRANTDSLSFANFMVVPLGDYCKCRGVVPENGIPSLLIALIFCSAFSFSFMRQDDKHFDLSMQRNR